MDCLAKFIHQLLKYIYLTFKALAPNFTFIQISPLESSLAHDLYLTEGFLCGFSAKVFEFAIFCAAVQRIDFFFYDLVKLFCLFCFSTIIW